MKRSILFPVALLLAFNSGDLSAKPDRTKNSARTAQGIMIDLKTSGRFAVSADATYEFDPQTKWLGDDNRDGEGVPSGVFAPVEYYTNGRTSATTTGGYTLLNVPSLGVQVGYKSVGGTGSGSLTNAELVTAMEAKAASATAKNSELLNLITSGNQNTGDWADFARGGTTAVLASSTYDVVIRHVTPDTAVRDYDFKYRFAIAPVPDRTFPALTGWYLVDEDDSGTARVRIGGTIAAQSLVMNQSAKRSTKKYDFGLENADGSSRIEDVVMWVEKIVGEDEDEEEEGYSRTPQHEIFSAGFDPDTNEFEGSFDYFSNAGTFGTAQDELIDGDARAILNNTDEISGDTFAGNDDGGADGRALQHAELQKEQFLLGAGDWRVTITGNIKGNEGAGVFDSAFSIEQELNIVLINPSR
jgi:hypothetical protein